MVVSEAQPLHVMNVAWGAAKVAHSELPALAVAGSMVALETPAGLEACEVAGAAWAYCRLTVVQLSLFHCAVVVSVMEDSKGNPT